MLDAPLILIGLVIVESTAAIGLGIAWRRGEHQSAVLRRALDRADCHVTNLQRALGDAYRDVDQFRAMANELAVENVAYRNRDRAIQAERAQAAARAARKKAKRDALKADDAKARRKHTVQALSNLRLRPRAEVVAEVRARRSA